MQRQSHPSATFMNLFQHSESNNSATPLIHRLVSWITSTRVYVNLIRNLSDMNAKITFISRTMINVKGITGTPKNEERFFLSSWKHPEDSICLARPLFIREDPLYNLYIEVGGGQQPLIPLRPRWEDGYNSITLNSLRQRGWGDGDDDERMGENRGGGVRLALPTNQC